MGAAFSHSGHQAQPRDNFILRINLSRIKLVARNEVCFPKQIDLSVNIFTTNSPSKARDGYVSNRRMEEVTQKWQWQKMAVE